MANITADDGSGGTYDYASLTALTKEQYIPKLVDNVKKKSVLLSSLLGGSRPNASGNSIHQPIEVANATSLGFYEKYDTMTIAPTEFAKDASYGWAQAYASVSISGFEERVNDNPEKLIDLMGAKMRNAEKSLTKKFANAFYGVSGADSVGNLISLVDIASQTEDLGGLGKAVWKGAFDQDMSADANIAVSSNVSNFDSMADNMDKIFRVYYNKMSKDAGERPTKVVVNQIFFDAMEQHLSDKKRTSSLASGEVADMGFTSMKFRGVDVIVDESIPDGEVYFLNEDYLRMVHSRKANFGFTGFKAPVDQDAKTGQILWMGQLICSNRSKAVGRLHSLPTDYTTATS